MSKAVDRAQGPQRTHRGLIPLSWALSHPRTARPWPCLRPPQHLLPGPGPTRMESAAVRPSDSGFQFPIFHVPAQGHPC